VGDKTLAFWLMDAEMCQPKKQPTNWSPELEKHLFWLWKVPVPTFSTFNSPSFLFKQTPFLVLDDAFLQKKQTFKQKISCEVHRHELFHQSFPFHVRGPGPGVHDLSLLIFR